MLVEQFIHFTTLAMKCTRQSFTVDIGRNFIWLRALLVKLVFRQAKAKYTAATKVLSVPLPTSARFGGISDAVSEI